MPVHSAVVTGHYEQVAICTRSHVVSWCVLRITCRTVIWRMQSQDVAAINSIFWDWYQRNQLTNSLRWRPCVISIHSSCVWMIGYGKARWKERKWMANRKYPDYRNKWENILYADLSCVMCAILVTWHALITKVLIYYYEMLRSKNIFLLWQQQVSVLAESRLKR